MPPSDRGAYNYTNLPIPQNGACYGTCYGDVPITLQALELRPHRIVRDARVALGHHHRAVPEQLLQHRQASTALEIAARERVPQPMHVKPLHAAHALDRIV